ncbi:dUTP diphosphatase [Candidatus Micrarchaeota archaeon]|nr:dUTP diphosphatase [Candidatus Micrarchaeota archaeon]MBU1940012.1 dUTP diphosphatase [Candidatus Micrarchaeota archaeon]
MSEDNGGGCDCGCGTLKVKVQKLWAELPELSYHHAGDSGIDLYAREDAEINAGERKLVGAGIKISLPEGYEAQVRPKSGLALNHGITVLNTPGTVDSCYRGEVGVILVNHGSGAYKVEKGKKIAQLVFARVERAELEIVEELDETTRNDGGFGSTGL